MRGADGNHPDSGSQFERDLLPWRERALDYVLWGGLAIATVPLSISFFVTPESDPRGLRVPSLGVFLVVAALAVARRAPYRVRCVGYLATLLALSALMLAARGLEGGGRLVLVVTPLYATVFLGPRAGYAAAGAGVRRCPAPSRVSRPERTSRSR